MLKDIILNVDLREEQEYGKNASRRLRKRGLVPAVLYGKGKKSVSVSVDPKKLIEILISDTGGNTIFGLQIAGKSSKDTVMIKDYQKDPVTDSIIHADFIKIDLQKAIEVKVPLHLIGIPEGVKQQGGILDIVIREIEVSCLPGDIPEHLELDVANLLIGQHLSVSDIKVSEKIKILVAPEQTVAVVTAPRIEEVAAPVEAAPVEAAEPEVIKKGKEEKEGEEEKGEQPEKGEAKEKEKKEKKEK